MSRQDSAFQFGHFIIESGRKNRKSHNFDESDIFFLDMMILAVRMVNAQRMLIGGDVVSQHQIQFVLAAAHSRNRRDGVVRHAFGLAEDEGLRIGVRTPFSEYHICRIRKSFNGFRLKAESGERPLDHARIYIFESRDCKHLFERCSYHWECITAALKMVVAQD